jgi:two-component system sensor histidine kinase KdpD
MAAVAMVTLLLAAGLHVSNAATISVTYLLLVLLVAATSRLAVAVVTSIAAMLSLNFFFLPPVGTFTIADPHNWIALCAFLVVSLVASHLSAVARARTDEAVGRRNELARLFDLSRDVLMVTESAEALSALARAIARRFDLEFVAIAAPRDNDWDLFEAGTRTIALDKRQLASAYAAAQATLEFDAYARTYAGHRTMSVNGDVVRLVPLRLGTKPIGVLAATGRPVEAGTLDTLAGVVAIAIERAHFLEERQAGELTRQSEQLKTALLASLGHDLRTPLTAIRIAATNIKSSELEAADRVEQSDVILSEVERLTRLFQNLLEMGRIDAGAITTEFRWTHPSEIVAAARDQVDAVLQDHTLEIAIDPDVPVRLDPRLAAAALAHLLENAAQYSPAGSVVQLTGRVADDGLTFQVRDHGPGIAAADLPHLFERFYRGAAARSRTSGTGMGLWIVRGLLAAANGQVWAENCGDGGARFTLSVPAETQQTALPRPTR